MISANISKNALKHLEEGTGVSIKTFISVLIALNKHEYLKGLAPSVSINPLDMPKGKARQRASSERIIKVHPDLEHKRFSLLSKYGLTLEQYVQLHIDQDKKCGNTGCAKELDLLAQSTHVDHNHITGKVRSLLCQNCNTALGHAQEDQNRLIGLLAYLDRHS